MMKFSPMVRTVELSLVLLVMESPLVDAEEEEEDEPVMGAMVMGEIQDLEIQYSINLTDLNVSSPLEASQAILNSYYDHHLLMITDLQYLRLGPSSSKLKASSYRKRLRERTLGLSADLPLLRRGLKESSNDRGK